MKKVIALKDYRNVFGSKHFAVPYRSGFDQDLLKDYFQQAGYELIFQEFAEIDLKQSSFQNIPIIYTSSEDLGYHYKSFIEDVIYALELNGAHTLPAYKYLRANNNKVFMEMLRDQITDKNFKGIQAKGYGCLEEFESLHNKKSAKQVIKTSEGASGKGVFLGKGRKNIKKIVRKISRSRYPRFEAWDLGRSFKHKGYIRESLHRKKFIIQDYIPNLQNDWKIYVFGHRYYIFYRPIFQHRGIKASGGGYDNYLYGSNAPNPDGLLDYVKAIFEYLDAPHLSIDVGYDGEQFYLFEFQCLYFGTAGIPYSKEYFIHQNNTWELIKEDLDQEKVYADSITEYINRKNL